MGKPCSLLAGMVAVSVVLNGCAAGKSPKCGDGVCERGEDSGSCPSDVGHTGVTMVSDGSVRCWGGNDDGELGNGSTTSSAIPVQVP